MTHQSFLLICLITLFLTAFSSVPLDRFFTYGTTYGDTEMERDDDTGSTANRARRQVEAHETWRNVSDAAEEEECEETNDLLIQPSDIVVVPTQMSITDEYGFDGNNTFHFYCAARGKKVEVFFTRSFQTGDRSLGNAKEEDMSRSEIEQIFDKEFVRSSKCITAKRLSIPFTNAESAGLYRCFAGKPYSLNYGSVQKHRYYNHFKEFKLKLERSGGMCHDGSEYPCDDGRQCISANQACDMYINKDCEDGSDEGRSHGCLMPDIVDMTPEEERLDIPEGGSVNFSCRAVGIGKFFPDPHIIWRVNFTVVDCKVLNCHQESENGTSILTLKNINRTNEGEYYCDAVTTGRSRSRSSSKHWHVHVVDKQPGGIKMAENPDEECEEAKVLEYESDVVLEPSDITVTDEYGFQGNNSVQFYCAARGKNTQVFFSRKGYYSGERLLGNATEEDMTRSEIEQIFDREFINSSKCITAKRLIVPFTNVESTGLYRCIAKNSYDLTSKYSRLLLKRSGGVCNFESEFRCADGLQCVSKTQVCNGEDDCQDSSDEAGINGCYQPLVVDMKPDEVNLDIPETDSLNLTCQAIGRPVPSIKWRVNGTDLSCVAPDCQQVSENGTGTLTLKNLKRGNVGTYTCEAIGYYKHTVPSRDWIVRVVDRVTYGKEIPAKFLGYWKLDHHINFPAYLNARYHSQPAREKAENDMRRKTILRTGTGSYSWVSKEGIYDNVVLGKEFPCTSSFCVDQSKWVVFVYLPTNETIIETHKMNSKSIYDYRYTLEDGKLVKYMEWGNVTAQLFYRNDDKK
ncbi:immunoglobulin domain-containing protein [Ditylenchus destructor]|nr:immunoglobulin domain-containing protein [Ditylenchus destructor]